MSDVPLPHEAPRSLTIAQRLDKLCDQFEEAWQAGQRPQIEEYLRLVDEGERPELLCELLQVELAYRRQRKEPLVLEEYQQRFSQYAERIESAFRAGMRDSVAPAGVRSSSQQTGDTGPKPTVAGATDIPSRLGRYRVLTQLGSGAFGVVYRAYDEELHRDVAIKVPHRDRIHSPRDIEAYLAEARILASLTHPGIVPVHDVGRTEDGLCYLVSRFVPGNDLRARIRQNRPTHAEAVEIIARVAEALHHAHQRGLVHRDLKPANILLEADGQPVVADFGLALREEDFGTGPDFVGTPAYMSPEQARSEGHRVDARTDVFSLGVVLYELLTGRRPFRGDTRAEVLEQIKTLEPRPPRQLDDSVPKELDRICLKALSKRASDRYSTALDLAEDLQHWQAGELDSSAAPIQVLNQPAFPVSMTPPPAAPSPAVGLPFPSGADSDQGPTKVVPRGLRSFDAEDADFFLELLPGPRNRDGLPESIRFWKTRIEAADSEKTFRVGLLYGPSGCGKSSLVKAGLLPRLADTILPLYVEATAADTETRLLKGLRKRYPALADNRGLVEVLTCLRRQPDASKDWISDPRQKVLLVLDQFEQWLHAWRGEPNTELVEALRQCDGEHLLCLVLVRDDFGMAATRFMSDLEIPILQGQNFATVDLFDLRHARKVLMEFGRAFGCLPEQRDAFHGVHEQFLDQAVAGLAQDGKVISVRLALFAEMVKGKPWTPATLRAVGGIEGLGVTFLEETFGSRAANPEYRLHERAARAVLKALLPDQGTDIRGHTRSHTELLAASGYARRPQAFKGLMRILDTDLRLITPADPERSPGDEEGSITRQPLASLEREGEGPSYQLTHDYLVPALRQWLTRKQRETRRGRMELLLAERVALWSVKKESRQLPGWWEWLNLLHFTRSKDWTVPQRQMLRAAAWKHLMQAGVLVLLLGLVGWAVFAAMQGPMKASALVRELASAETRNVPEIIDELFSCRYWADPQLRKMMARHGPESKEHFHASLALFPVDPGQKEYLLEKLFEPPPHECNPEEFLAICQVLEKKQNPDQELVARSRDLLTDPTASASQRFRAACVLAKYDPYNPHWDDWSDEVATWLILGEGRLFVAKWQSSLQSVRYKLAKSLEGILRDPQRPESERHLAAARFLRFVGNELPLSQLMNLVLETDGGAYKELVDWFMAKQDQIHPEAAAEVVNKELARRLPPNASQEEKEDLAMRQAHAAVVLLQLDQRDDIILPLRQAKQIWEMLRQGSDPRLRTYLIHRLGRVGVNPETLIQQYQVEQDPSIRRALLLSLGEFDSIKLPAEKQKKLLPRLLGDYRSDADAGIHSAVDWLLRRGGQEAALRKIDQEMAGQSPNPRQWYVTKRQGHTLAVFPGPVTLPMSSPDAKPDTHDNEKRHERPIRHSFALATKEVTLRQFEEFLQANPEVAARFRKRIEERYSPDLDGPVVGVTWLEAAQYCRWLSEQEHVPEDQMCYPEIAKIKAGMALPSDFLSRTGYRLPTDAEWEYACRAGAATSRPFGSAEGMLDSYAWYVKNSNSRAQLVGSKKPNDFGMFDMLGNAWEWCQDAFAPYSFDAGKEPTEDSEDKDLITNSAQRVLRGGAFLSPASEVRSAFRMGYHPHLPFVLAGLRVARTCR